MYNLKYDARRIFWTLLDHPRTYKQEDTGRHTVLLYGTALHAHDGVRIVQQIYGGRFFSTFFDCGGPAFSCLEARTRYTRRPTA